MSVARSYFFLFLFVVIVLWISDSGCQKEHSFEGADTIAVIRHDSTIQSSPVPVLVIPFPPCDLCNESDSNKANSWNFKTGNSYLCGGLTNAGFIGGTTTITFFGPSACSEDTGLVMTVYLPVTFDQNRTNITASEAAFYYYDNHATKDILISRQSQPFTVHIASYNNQTRVTKGSFYGPVFTANGDTAYVRSGNFSVTLR